MECYSNNGFFISIIIFGLHLIHKAHSACSWPAEFQSTGWHDSTRGVITFGTSDMQGWAFEPTSGTILSSWECVSVNTYNTDGRLIMVTSQSFSLSGSTYYLYMCISVTKVTDVSYQYYMDQPVNTNLHENERLFMYTVNTITDPSIICSDNNGASGSEYQMLIQTGSEFHAKIDCPYSFLDRHGYTHATSSGVTSCDQMTSTLDVCTDTQHLNFDYTACSTQVAYSISNEVWCVNNVPVGDVNYVMVYNGNDDSSLIDDVTIFRFSCFAITGNGSAASISPLYCQSGQVPDQFPHNRAGIQIGAKLQLSDNSDTCPTCPMLNDPERGSVAITTPGAVTSATYTCETNYTLWGSDTRICQPDHTWTNDEPFCNCAVPPSPSHGDVSVNVDGTVATYTCDVSYTLNGLITRSCQSATSTWEGSDPICALCLSLATITGQTITRTSNGTVTSASFTCASGYTLNGASLLTCSDIGTWNTFQPNCVVCSVLNNPLSGHISLTTDGSVTTATYNCSAGYYLQGDTSRTCQLDGSWDGTQPTCFCSSPANPTNGAVVSTGTDATYTCNTGFTISGPTTRTCQEDGTGWSSYNPSCTMCSTLATVTGGSYTLSSTGTVTSATYTCDVGYSLNGATTITCEASGSWNNFAPNCVECQPLTDPDSGNVELSSTGSKTSATYTCASGYNLIGNAISLCNSDGTWTLVPPVCTCQSPSQLLNGDVTDDGSTATYTCLLGYSLHGVHTDTCSTDGSGWSGSPYCTICNTLTFPTGGVILMTTDGINTEADFECNTGYTLNGITPISCRSDGTWDFSQPTCTKCPDLQNPDSGTVTITTTGSVTTATFECETGYYNNGDYLLTCQTDGTWDNAVPTCKCRLPQTPNNGAVSVSDGSSGTIATYSCDSGYSLTGLGTRTCETDGTGWEGQDPSCTVCQLVTVPTDGTFSLTSNSTHTLAHFSCDERTTLSGYSELVCLSDGTWHESFPICVACDTLSISASGVINFHTDGTTTTATFTCFSGYSLNSTSTLTCKTDGTWNLPEPVCICQAPSLISNGEYMLSTDLLTATYTCNLGYVLVGSATRTCMNDGTGWTGISPSCDLSAEPDTGQSTENSSNDKVYIAVVIVIVVILIVVILFLILFIHLYCRLRREQSSRVHSAVSREPEEPKVVKEAVPDTLPEPKPTDKKSRSYGQKYQHRKDRPVSAITATDVSLPNLSPKSPRSPKVVNGNVPLTSVRLPKLTSRAPAGHELDAARHQGQKIRHGHGKGKPSITNRPKTPIERMKEIGLDRMMTPELLASAEFNYIHPQYCYDVEGSLASSNELKLSKKGRRHKKDKHEKKRTPRNDGMGSSLTEVKE